MGRTYGLILAIFASKIRNCVLILQRYNLFELSFQSKMYCAHSTKYIAILYFGYYASVHISGAYFPACSAVQWDTNYHIGISNIITLHETFVACINSKTTLEFAYLYFSFFLRFHCFTDSVCMYRILHLHVQYE